MVPILLGILKIIGMILLAILCILLVLLLTVLFVPVRYSAKAVRSLGDDAPVRISAKITWLLHAASVSFWYPKEEYLRVRIFGIPVWKAGTEAEDAEERDDLKETKHIKKKHKKREEKEKRTAEKTTEKTAEKTVEKTAEKTAEKIAEETSTEEKTDKDPETEAEEKTEKATIFSFFRKLWKILKNIKYTILKICDKIKHIIRNIKYYIRVLQSDSFKRAWDVCKGEAFSLIGSILPKKLSGHVTVGTGDPASTAQILAVHGILYPLIGNHIFITPDFENSVLEGDFYMRGKITVFKILKTAGKVYFNKDLRRVIRLLKREAA